MRLLIADDDPSLQVALRMVCELAGHDVTTVETAGEARRALEGTDFDAVLVDGGISGDGRALWRSLRVDAPYEGRVVLITGDVAELGSLAQARDVLAKPFDYDALLAQLAAMGARDA